MADDEFRILERQLLLQISAKAREIADLQAEKATLERLLYKARKREVADREVTRSNSIGRLMAEGAIMDKIDASPRFGVQVATLEIAAREAVPGMGQSTFRSHIRRLRERGLIESPARGVWRRAHNAMINEEDAEKITQAWRFNGKNGAQALTIRREGDNLPDDLGPWYRFRLTSIPENYQLELVRNGFVLINKVDS